VATYFLLPMRLAMYVSAPCTASRSKICMFLWPILLLFGIALDAVTTYLTQAHGFEEFNTVAGWLMSKIGPTLAVVVMKGGLLGLVLAFYLLYRRLKSYPFYAICVSYATFSWVPGLHNLLLLYCVALNPAATLTAQFFASFVLYLHLVYRHYARRRRRRPSIIRQES